MVTITDVSLLKGSDYLVSFSDGEQRSVDLSEFVNPSRDKIKFISSGLVSESGLFISAELLYNLALPLLSLSAVFKSMAKLGKTGDIRNYDDSVGIIPYVNNVPKDIIHLPSGLLKFKDLITNVQWDYNGDELISKFFFNITTKSGFTLMCKARFIDEKFELSMLTAIFNGAVMHLSGIESIKIDDFLSVCESEDLNVMISFISDHYPMNEAIERKLRS